MGIVLIKTEILVSALGNLLNAIYRNAKNNTENGKQLEN